MSQPVVNLAWLIAKLEREQYHADSASTPDDEAQRKGWNDRARSLILELRVELGLAELRDAPIDLRLRDELVGFDLGGES